jgi:hypothetical protein
MLIVPRYPSSFGRQQQLPVMQMQFLFAWQRHCSAKPTQVKKARFEN